MSKTFEWLANCSHLLALKWYLAPNSIPDLSPDKSGRERGHGPLSNPPMSRGITGPREFVEPRPTLFHQRHYSVEDAVADLVLGHQRQLLAAALPVQ